MHLNLTQLKICCRQNYQLALLATSIVTIKFITCNKISINTHNDNRLTIVLID